MQVSKPSLGKYLRRAVATRSWRLELEVTLERARRPISKKGHPGSAPCRAAVGERGRRNLQAYERTRHQTEGAARCRYSTGWPPWKNEGSWRCSPGGRG